MMKIILRLLFLSSILVATPSWAACLIGTTTAVSATTTSALLLAANRKRCGLLLVNDGAVTVYVKPGSALTGTEGVPIIASGNWEPYRMFGDALYIKAASGTQSVRVIEWEEK